MGWTRSVIVVVLATTLLPLVISYRNLTKTEKRFEKGDFNVNVNVNGFKEGDRIPLFVNTIKSTPLFLAANIERNHSFEYHNPCFTLPFFEFPFCPPGDPIFNRKKTLKEILDGDCYTPTQYELKFKVGTIRKILCEKNLTKDEVSKFRYAVRHEFRYYMYHDNIKFESNVGSTTDSRIYLFTHINFYPHYYENQVRHIQSTGDYDSDVDITEDTEIKVNFTYSVFWKDLNISDNKFVLRKESSMKKDRRPVVWNPIFLTLIGWAVRILFWPGLLLSGSLAYLMSYFNRNSQGNVTNTTGVVISQQITDDARRSPPYSSLLGAILGIGIQHLIVICSFFLMAYIGVLYPCHPKSLYNRLRLVYCLSSVVSGYRATSFHARYSAHGWKECVFQTGALYFLPVFLTIPVINSVINTSYQILRVPTNLPECCTVLFILWTLGTVIFLILGSRIGYYVHFESQEPNVTSRTQSQRDIPQQSWWMSTRAQMFIGGLLPFMTIFRDMDEIYASLWNLKVCGAFSSLFKAFLLVTIMTVFVGMGYTYHQMSKQDDQWWWRSVFRGGSTAIFMFAYGINFYFRSDEEDYLQLLYFLGYTACIFYSFSLVLGTIGFFASSTIAHRMYSGLDKRD